MSDESNEIEPGMAGHVHGALVVWRVYVDPGMGHQLMPMDGYEISRESAEAFAAALRRRSASTLDEVKALQCCLRGADAAPGSKWTICGGREAAVPERLKRDQPGAISVSDRPL